MWTFLHTRGLGWCLALGLSLLSGCTSAPDPDAANRQVYEQYLNEQLSNKAELAELLTTVRDKDTMAQAYPKLYELNQAEEALITRSLTLPILSNETLLQLQDKLQKMVALKERIRQEARRIQELPGGPAFLKELSAEHRGSEPDAPDPTNIWNRP